MILLAECIRNGLWKSLPLAYTHHLIIILNRLQVLIWCCKAAQPPYVSGSETFFIIHTSWLPHNLHSATLTGIPPQTWLQ